jgi:hypothetical protein
MQNIIQIYTCLLKLSRKQESVMDGQTDRRMAAITISPHRYCGGIIILRFDSLLDLRTGMRDQIK